MEKCGAGYYIHESNTVNHGTMDVVMPRMCMHCRQTGEQVFLTMVASIEENDLSAGIAITACSYCGRMTLHYLDVISDKESDKYYFTVSHSVPKEQILSENLPRQIKEDFRNFAEIYSQSIEAEKAGLDKVAGMGLRKATEFLVTDYLIQYLPEGITEDWLKDPKTSLSQKISKIGNARTRAIAKAIAYLGNDETHYSRQHPEYDIDSIKWFIKALISDIENEIAFKEAQKLITK